MSKETMSGEALLAALDRLGMTQSELARRIKSYPATVHSWTNERRPVPGAVEAYVGLLLDLHYVQERQRVRGKIP